MNTTYYEMGCGKLIATAGRKTTIKTIRCFQDEEWARKQGGICGIRTLTEPRAIYFAELENKKIDKIMGFK